MNNFDLEEPMNNHDDWEEVWNARLQALEQVLGPCTQTYHAPLPFALGGQADVVAFGKHLQGVVYVTAELTGKREALYADYELMICDRGQDTWGANAISCMAAYTQEARISAGDTMDIDSAAPKGSTITALIFDNYSTFALFGETYDLRLCIGITKEELQFKMKYGSSALLERLKREKIYPFTDFDRR
jgi:Suppressor of fused protein (SUFU)